MRGNERPYFVKGRIKVEVDGQILEYRDKNISLFGVMGLPWRPLVPSMHFGRPVMVLLHIPISDPVIFRTRAHITRETTRYSSLMGLKFELGPAQSIKLRKTIEEHGFVPTDHMRKFPRIPAYEWLGDFPVRAGVKLVTGKNVKQLYEAIFDVADLSPTGALLETENPSAAILIPGQKIHLGLEPRGKFGIGVSVPALVCRTVDAVNSKNNNTLRQVGVAFTGMQKTDQRIYLAWLHDILTDLKRGKPLL